ncbi:MAG: superoxide dismutase [Epsilonproteobacteria bacterium]|nr:superoxide dismutase [Campylobacterota bacterium]OIO14621.1 MAG: superoxide dismutase [Helicobacteraceae bacterium CG1_02_36_14]PIP09577.1 MAG: superoxide dismutase [Sulfurimonas sp. CG23_combo_of_CG06-09_8_20_14_all_36_33]PIS25306.1 MAG: superoxide dismutase [Sulfurimonas sp. CG08_land_8_20_14_0_20_36_33]PIU33564.1 MAG: superoxide dismutase [Sulfurimonas sp. CG07_land_8_20_14_0_80_36_56]PIV04033.1 MAG: superoxide dismutase [Sulfurimonas sp. CG03_land_8_20_14_0_80_36_25]PIV35559.1 MAG: sup
MVHELIKLPYAYNALEPIMSTETLQYHHGKHHAGYISKLNSLIPGTEYETKSLVEMIKHAEGAIFNNAAQVYNHDFFWTNLSPENTTPSLALDSIINAQFGSVEAFKKAFIEKGLALFGSGWVWLCIDEKTNLSIVSTSNADNPIRSGLVPLMVCDVWEHAYYIDYRNARADYLEGFWKLVNWKFVSFNYANHEKHRGDYFSNFCSDNTPYCDYVDSIDAMENAGS